MSGTHHIDWEGKDPLAVVQLVMRESYLDSMEDLKAYAEKVKYYNQLKKAIREYLQELRCVRSKVLAAARERGLETTKPSPSQARQLTALIRESGHAFEAGALGAAAGLPDRVPARNIDTLEQLADELANWEDQLSTLGDDAQLANVDMQSALQKVQQSLQMMSNVSKMLHDDAMAVIRKIGG